MKVIEISEPGTPDVLKVAQRPIPEPGVGEVLIKVSAAGINRPDVMQRQGMYPAPPGASDIPGLEISGVVEACGVNSELVKQGDVVCALVTGGGYAEYCLAAAALCLPVPKGLEIVEAAALPETFFTVWSNVFERGALTQGEKLLVHGGTSGIGTTSIQLAKAFGSRIFVTAGSDAKCQACIDLGADAAINYREKDFVEEIESYTDGKGVNVLLDMIGGDYLDRNLKCLAPDGRLVQIALQKGPKTNINLLPIMLKRLTLTGSTLRARSVKFKAELAAQLKHKVWPLFEDDSIKPVVYKIFDLDDAKEAHRLMESSQHFGKILLTVAP